MKRILAAVAALAVMVGPLFAIGLFYNDDTVVGDTNTAVTFTDNGSGGTAAAFRARYVAVYSLPASADTCYVDFKDTTATIADTPVEPGGIAHLPPSISAEYQGIPGVGVICDTGDSATFRIFASR